MRPLAVIFDVDGTLLDSVDLHAEAWAEIFRRFGRDVPAGEVRRQIGKGGAEILPMFFSPDEIARDGDRMREERKHLFARDYLSRARPFPGVRALFERIRRDGVRIALGSSAVHEEVAHHARLLGVEDLLDATTSSDDADRPKPFPDIFAAARERLGSPAPERTLVVGDSPYDVEAARNAGLRCIGVLSGGFGADALRDAGAIAIYDGPADLLARSDESPFARG